MSHYTHLTILEREQIFLLKEIGYSIRKIAKELKRSPSTISRELKKSDGETYSPSLAQAQYKKRKTFCGRRPILNSREIWELVYHLFIDLQWSPEQIDHRLKYEKSALRISYTTIYRAIYAGVFETEQLSHGNRGHVRELRHKGKTRHTASHQENRGRIKITHTIHDRPALANNRKEIGHWEADTVVGKTGGACLVTLTDRKTRFLVARKVAKKIQLLFVRK